METTLTASTSLDLLRPAVPRRARFQRDTPPPMRLTADDLAMIRHVAKHRFLRSTHLIALLDRPAKKILERLAALYHNAYLDRPRAQLDYYRTAGSAPIVYALGNKGAAILAELDRTIRATAPKAASNLTIAETIANQTASSSAPTQVASKLTPTRSPYPGIGAPGSCPVPSNYLITTGEYLSRADGNLITIMEAGNAPSSLPVTDEIFSAVRNISPGTVLTLFCKYSAEGLPEWSSAQILSVYCIELVP